jgi:UrcA family protein
VIELTGEIPMNHLFTSVCLSVYAALACASVAVADPYGLPDRIEQVSRAVQLSDVDVHTAAGAKVAADRIRSAAEYVCGGDDLEWRPDYGYILCRDHAIDRALASLQAPLVSAALHRPSSIGLAGR